MALHSESYKHRPVETVTAQQTQTHADADDTTTSDAQTQSYRDSDGTAFRKLQIQSCGDSDSMTATDPDPCRPVEIEYDSKIQSHRPRPMQTLTTLQCEMHRPTVTERSCGNRT